MAAGLGLVACGSGGGTGSSGATGGSAAVGNATALTSYSYVNNGLDATLRPEGTSWTLVVTNDSGTDVGAPGVYSLDPTTGERVDAAADGAMRVPDGTGATFKVRAGAATSARTGRRRVMATQRIAGKPRGEVGYRLRAQFFVERSGRWIMSDGYLPEIYKRFRGEFPEAARALDGLGAATDAGGPLDDRTRRLVKLGIAVGAEAEGAVRSNARRALAAGATPEEIRHVALLAISTRGFPAAVASLGWIEEVLNPQT